MSIITSKMTKQEAQECLRKFYDQLEGAFETLTEFKNREGWAALGYKSFAQFRREDPDFMRLYGTKSTNYRLLNQEQVEKNVGEPVPITHAEVLRNVPADQQAAVVAKAKRIAGGKPTTAEHVKSATPSKWKKSTEISLGDYAAKDGALRDALVDIGKVCGKPFKEALENGTIPIKKSEVLALADLQADIMIQVEKLVSVNRLPVARAIQSLTDMLNEDHEMKRYIWQALAAPGGVGTWTVGGMDIRISPAKGRRQA